MVSVQYDYFDEKHIFVYENQIIRLKNKSLPLACVPEINLKSWIRRVRSFTSV